MPPERSLFAERTAARRIALQALYQLDVQGEGFLDCDLYDFVNESTEDPKTRELSQAMAAGAWRFQKEADAWFGRLAAKWPVYRMATVDRNVLRLAAWELTHAPNVPPKVVLDEAINLAKEFSTADSAPFVNGILDAILKEHLAATGRSLEQ